MLISYVKLPKTGRPITAATYELLGREPFMGRTGSPLPYVHTQWLSHLDPWTSWSTPVLFSFGMWTMGIFGLRVSIGGGYRPWQHRAILTITSGVLECLVTFSVVMAGEQRFSHSPSSEVKDGIQGNHMLSYVIICHQMSSYVIICHHMSLYVIIL